jgi:hypothetical protein
MSVAAFEVLKASGRQYSRQPINLFLLVILPPLFVLALGSAFSTFSDVLGGNVSERQGSAMAAVWVAALLSGSAAFFVLSASRRADERLVLSGLGLAALEGAHAAAGVVLAVGTGSIGFLVVILTNDVSSPLELWMAIVAGAVAYSALGATIAFVIEGDLEGSFVIILVFMLDAFVAGPLGGPSGLWPNFFPLHHSSEIAMDAVIHAGPDVSRFWWTAAYAGLLAGIAALAHTRRLS